MFKSETMNSPPFSSIDCSLWSISSQLERIYNQVEMLVFIHIHAICFYNAMLV